MLCMCAKGLHTERLQKESTFKGNRILQQQLLITITIPKSQENST